MIKKIFLLFITWRLFLYLPLIASQSFLGFRTGFEYTRLTYFLSDKTSVLTNFLFYPFGNFDGVYYLLIAAKGYTVNAGFFPLFPLSIHFLSSFFGNTLPFSDIQYFSALFLESVFFLTSLIFLYKLIKIDYPNKIALNTIVLMLLFPTSFFFAAIYSESLFLLLLVLSFYFARKKNWLASSIFGMLLTATRFVGIAILPALLYEFYTSEKSLLKTKILPLLIIPLGIISYSWYNLQKWGDAFYFIQAQGNFQNNRSVDSIILFPQTIFRYIKILITLKPTIYEWWVAFFEITFFVFALTLFYVAWKKRIRISYLIFGFLCFLIPASSGTFTGLPRYIAIIFPIFIALALIKNKVFKIVYCVISMVLLFLFFMLFSKGYFIA